MYDELVKDLRICAEGEHCDKCGKWEVKQNGGRNACEYAICTEAADAIEKLKKAVNFHKFNSEFWEDKYNSLADEKWIPVTERLPEVGERVLCYCRANIYEVMKMRTDGAWVHNDTVYDGTYMSGFVTHWMPLPNPPKEE